MENLIDKDNTVPKDLNSENQELYF